MRGRMTADESAAVRVGRQHLERGEDEAALAAFERVLGEHPGFADLHYLVGLVHERRGDLDAAATSFERALAINPRYAECALALSTVYERRGEWERSRALAARLGEAASEGGALDPTTSGKIANLHAELGDAYREAGELREAVLSYRKALERAPGFHDIRFRLGVTLREAGLPAQAIAELKRVQRGNPAYLEASVQLGLTYWSLGRSEQAIAEWQRVVAADPTRRDAPMYLRLCRPPGGAEPRARNAPSPKTLQPRKATAQPSAPSRHQSATRKASSAGTSGWSAMGWSHQRAGRQPARASERRSARW
jgi:tetratricopeptide (TPR) repeat protein